MFMTLVQMPECGGFDLTWADKLRKSIAKKNPKDFEKLQEEYFKVTTEKGLSKNLCNYVWNVLVSTSKGYGFNKSHTLAYSLIALQEMNLAYNFPIVFWNCACLITDSGGSENDEETDDEGTSEFIWDSTVSVSITDFNDDDEEEESETDDDDSGTNKKKSRSVDYGKIATAIGRMRDNGIIVSPPDINNSGYTFSPDPDNNIIRYGLSGINKIGEALVKSIIDNRPYSSLNDFINKVKSSKPQIINLIKSGAFDSLGDRVSMMNNYINSISDTKKDLNLRNMKMLIDYDMLPREQFDKAIRVYNFNKYIKAYTKENYNNELYYLFDDRAFTFYSSFFDLDNIIFKDDNKLISQKVWNKIYNKELDCVRDYLKDNKEEVLFNLNQKIIKEEWDKYASGSISKWEMDSVSFYSHEHELIKASNKYCFENFNELPEEPEVEYTIEIKGKEIPIFKLSRIAGTVLDKDKLKGTVTLLTIYGVVIVRIWQNQFVKYNKQISEKLPTGKKKIIEKSWFSRGNKLAIVGIRRGDSFIPKIYKNSKWTEPINLIKSIDDNGNIEFQHNRIGEE